MSEPPIHRCHYPGCEVLVPPVLHMCKPHWWSVPKRFRDRLWKEYRRGQEIRKDPSPAYLQVVLEIQAWAIEQKKMHQARQRSVDATAKLTATARESS